MGSIYLKNVSLFDGQVFMPDHCSLWLKDGKIHAIFGENEIPDFLPAGTRLFDLAGNTVMPTFIEGHCHFLATALKEFSVNMRLYKSVEEAGPDLQKLDALLPQGEWIYGGGWHLEMEGAAHIDSQFLDKYVPHRPVMLESRDYHAVWLNSAAIDTMNLSTFAWKNQKGVLWENERFVAYERSIPPSTDWVKKITRQLTEKFLTFGFSGAVCMEFTRDFEILAPVFAEQEETFQFSWFAPTEFLPIFEKEHIQPGDKYGGFIVSGIKIFMDGAFGSRTAHLSQPYAGTQNYGVSLIDDKELQKVIHAANTAGFPVAIHAIGDKAIFRAAKALKKYGDPALQNRLEHVQLPSEEALALIAKMGVAIAIQPCHIPDDIPMIDSLLPDRKKACYPFKKMRQYGIPLILSSDSPVADFHPWENIYSAVTHGCPHQPALKLNPEYTISLSDALTAAIINPRQFSSLNTFPGIKVGTDATLQVLNTRLSPGMNPEELLQVRPKMTIVNGKIEFKEESL